MEKLIFNGTIPFNLSKEDEKELHKNIKVFMDKYLEAEKDKMKLNHNKYIRNFGIKELCYSCYLQGLSDMNQALDK